MLQYVKNNVVQTFTEPVETKSRYIRNKAARNVLRHYCEKLIVSSIILVLNYRLYCCTDSNSQLQNSCCVLLLFILCLYS